MNPPASSLPSNRRAWLSASATAGLALAWKRPVNAALTSVADPATASTPVPPGRLDRIRGLLIGTMIGDALGGPVEFQDPVKVQALHDPPHHWRPDEELDARAVSATVSRLRLRSYKDLRPVPEPYAHWTPDAPPGTITDDSRHKLILLEALRHAERRHQWPLDVREIARAYLDWPDRPEVRDHPGYPALASDWLKEWRMSARWILGERDPSRALPPERMWNGLPTCCGQMTLPPLAALYPGQPEAAYRAAFHLAFFDNGWGRDLNAGWMAALAAALGAPPAPKPGPESWKPVLDALRLTDPFRFREIPWCSRAVDRWLAVVRRHVDRAQGRPALLFEALEAEFRETVKWEAQVPFVVSFAVLEIAGWNPLAALQLSIEWGHDTDSYAQMVGAMIGARHGASIFPTSLREPVVARLRADYGEDLEASVLLLDRLQVLAARGTKVIDETGVR